MAYSAVARPSFWGALARRARKTWTDSDSVSMWRGRIFTNAPRAAPAGSSPSAARGGGAVPFFAAGVSSVEQARLSGYRQPTAKPRRCSGMTSASMNRWRNPFAPSPRGRSGAGTGGTAVRKFEILLVSWLTIDAAGATQDPAPEGLLGPRHGPPQPIGRNVRALPGDYFPLATGNLWIYKGSGVYSGTFLTLEIT